MGSSSSDETLESYYDADDCDEDGTVANCEAPLPQPADVVARKGGDRFPISEIVESATRTVVGWRIVCGRHTDADGNCATACKKSVYRGKSGLDPSEARKRLLRWLVLGKTAEHKFNPERQRTSHVEWGKDAITGRRAKSQLAEFASDGPWGDMDLDELLQQLDA